MFMDEMMMAILPFALGALATVITTIILCITVVPDKKRDKLKGFGRTLNDIFNFRSLLIEAIIKFFYVLSTTACVVMGFFSLFLVVDGDWYGWVGLIAMIIGPIAVRLAFEACMLFILLVKNTISINNKLKDQYAAEKQASKAPAVQNYGYQQPVQQNYRPMQTYQNHQQPVQPAQQTPVMEQAQPVQPAQPAGETTVLNENQQ